MINETQATEILNAFGPNSMHRECLTPKELIADLIEDPDDKNTRDWLDFRLTLEDVFWERQQGGDRTDEQIEDYLAFMAAIEHRVKSLELYKNPLAVTVPITLHKGIATFPDGSTVAATVKQIQLLPELISTLKWARDRFAAEGLRGSGEIVQEALDKANIIYP